MTNPLRRKPRPPIPRALLPAGASPCDHCIGKCCRYFSLPIDTPQTWEDFDDIRWYLAHGQTLIYVSDRHWYLMVLTRCGYLQADNRCGIYHQRPRICREFSSDDCEYDDDWKFELVFEHPEQVVEYAEAVLKQVRPPASAPAPALVSLPPPQWNRSRSNAG